MKHQALWILRRWLLFGDATLVNSGELVENTEIEKDLLENTEINSGEEEETEAANANVDDYFTESKLTRDKMYSQMLESYQKILESPNVGESQKQIASQEINNINNRKNAIMICENLIKNKGLDDIIIFVNDKNISVILKTKDLTEEQIAQVQNILSRELNAEIENIHISTKN